MNIRQRNLVIGLIAIGGLVMVFFGLRTLHAFRQFDGHRPPPPLATRPLETDVELIRDWMTIPFISKTYHVRPGVLFDALDIPEHGNQEKSLRQLNDEYYPETHGLVLERVKDAVETALQAFPRPTIPAPP